MKRFLMWAGATGTGIGTVACFYALCGIAAAQTAPSPLSWQEIRANQPPSLHLKVTLPKTEYQQGELIEAKLDYSNDDPATTYSLGVGAEGPGGVFCAEDANGHRVANPREWVDEVAPVMEDGLSMISRLGSYQTNLTVNHDVRFDRPGAYALFAEASVDKDHSGGNHPVWIVSDKVTITIDRLTRAREREIIADALAKIGAAESPDENDARKGFAELNELQTRKALDAELPFLGKPKLAWTAGQGFLLGPNPAKQSVRILNAVKSGDLIVGQDGIYIYGMAKAFATPHLPMNGMSNDRRQSQNQAIEAAQSAARKEIVDALVAASGQSGPHQAQVLWTAFEQTEPHGAERMPDPDGGVARAALAKHQLELSPDEIVELFNNWTYWGSADFLPLVRREATASNPDPFALVILARSTASCPPWPSSSPTRATPSTASTTSSSTATAPSPNTRRPAPTASRSAMMTATATTSASRSTSRSTSATTA